MLTAAIPAPKISFDTVALNCFSADALLSARRYWIISPQIPSRFPEHDAEVHCMPTDHDAAARAAFNAAVHHSRSSIMVLAVASGSASPAFTSPPWKCAQSVATGIWTDDRTGAS